MDNSYPTRWQKKTIWTSLTGLALVVLVCIVVGTIWVLSKTLGFLQPILIPFAIAAVLAYLLEPVVAYLVRKGLTRMRAVLVVFAAFLVLSLVIVITVVPPMYRQGAAAARNMPGYLNKAEVRLEKWAEYYDNFFDRIPVKINLGPSISNGGIAAESETSPSDSDTEAQAETEPDPDAANASEATGESANEAPPENKKLLGPFDKDHVAAFLQTQLPKLQEQIPVVLGKLGTFVTGSIGGFLGMFGFLLGMIIVPLYLFFFLLEAPAIAASWSGYLPLKESRFKEELVSCLTEINGYLIAFFRGQLLVSLIDGALTAIALLIMGLDFALLIGLLVAVLGLIPYLGIILSLLPALAIALVQFGNWQGPLIVIAIFIVVQNLDGIFIAPKIVGDSVGLHPLTVIISVLGWSFLIGGLLGAILAVPLTATLKVLLRRYVWEKRILRSGEMSQGPAPAPTPTPT